MAQITAAAVKALRERTGLPMMECKKALTECDGDETAAIDWLNKRYKGKMEERAERETGEGWIGIHISDDEKVGGIIELRCETAPVAKNDVFVNLARSIARAVAEQDEKEPASEKIMEQKLSTGESIKDMWLEAYSKLQETMNLVRCRKITGEFLTHYIHHDGKSGILLALDAKPNPDTVGVDLAQHAIFTKPAAIVREELPAEQIQKVKEMNEEIAQGEGKPPQIIEKIVQGKINAYCKENALMEQEHVKPDYDKKSVRDVLKEAGVSSVTDMTFMVVGG